MICMNSMCPRVLGVVGIKIESFRGAHILKRVHVTTVIVIVLAEWVPGKQDYLSRVTFQP